MYIRVLFTISHPPYHSSLDLYKEFHEEAYSIALHPSGLFVLVGFSEKLRLLNLLIDDIRPFKEFMIRGCREVLQLCTTCTRLCTLLAELVQISITKLIATFAALVLI